MDIDVREIGDLDGGRLCRLCLENGEDTVYIFDPKGYNGFRVWEIIKELLQLEVSKEDGLPGTICRCCLMKVTEFKQFKTLCIKSKIRILTIIAGRGIVNSCSNNIPTIATHAQGNKDRSSSKRPAHSDSENSDLEVVGNDDKDTASKDVRTIRTSSSLKNVSNKRKKRDSSHALTTSSQVPRKKKKGSVKGPASEKKEERDGLVDLVKEDATNRVEKDVSSNRSSRDQKPSKNNKRKKVSDNPQIPSTTSHDHKNQDSGPSKRPAHSRTEAGPNLVEVVKENAEDKARKGELASRSSSGHKEASHKRQKRVSDNPQIPSTTSHDHKNQDSGPSKRPSHSRTEAGPNLVEVAKENAEDKARKGELASRSSSGHKEASHKRQKRDITQIRSTSSHGQNSKDSSSSKRPAQSRTEERPNAVEVVTDKPAKDRQGSRSSKRPAQNRTEERPNAVEVVTDKAAKDRQGSRSSSSRKEMNKNQRKRDISADRQRKVPRHDDTPSTPDVIDCGLSDVDDFEDVTTKTKLSTSAKEVDATPAKVKTTTRHSKNFVLPKDAICPLRNDSATLEDENRARDSSGNEPQSSKRSKTGSKGQKSKGSSNKSAKKGENRKKDGEAKTLKDNAAGTVNFIEVSVSGDVAINVPESNCETMADPLAIIKAEPVEDANPRPQSMPQGDRQGWRSGPIYDSIYSNLGPVKEECFPAQDDASGCPTRFQLDSGAGVARAEVNGQPGNNADMEFEEEKYSTTLLKGATTGEVAETALNAVFTGNAGTTISADVQNEDPLRSTEEERVNFISIVPNDEGDEDWSGCSNFAEVDEDPLADSVGHTNQSIPVGVVHPLEAKLSISGLQDQPADGGYQSGSSQSNLSLHCMNKVVEPESGVVEQQTGNNCTLDPQNKDAGNSGTDKDREKIPSSVVDLNSRLEHQDIAKKTSEEGNRNRTESIFYQNKRMVLVPEQTTPKHTSWRYMELEESPTKAESVQAKGSESNGSHKKIPEVAMSKMMPFVVLRRLDVQAEMKYAHKVKSKEGRRKQNLDQLRFDSDEHTFDEEESSPETPSTIIPTNSNNDSSLSQIPTDGRTEYDDEVKELEIITDGDDEQEAGDDGNPSRSSRKRKKENRNKRLASSNLNISSSDSEEWTPSALDFSAESSSDSSSDDLFRKKKDKVVKTSAKKCSKQEKSRNPDPASHDTTPSTTSECRVKHTTENGSRPQEISLDKDSSPITPPGNSLGLECNSISIPDNSQVTHSMSQTQKCLTPQSGEKVGVSGNESTATGGVASCSDIESRSSTLVQMSETGACVVSSNPSIKSHSGEQRIPPIQTNPEALGKPTALCLTKNHGSSSNVAVALENVSEYKSFKLSICGNSPGTRPTIIFTPQMVGDTQAVAGVDARPFRSTEVDNLGGVKTKIPPTLAKSYPGLVNTLTGASSQGLIAGEGKTSIVPASTKLNDQSNIVMTAPRAVPSNNVVGAALAQGNMTPALMGNKLPFGASVFVNSGNVNTTTIFLNTVSADSNQNMMVENIPSTTSGNDQNLSSGIPENKMLVNTENSKTIPGTNSGNDQSMHSLVPGISKLDQHERSRAIASTSSSSVQKVSLLVSGNTKSGDSVNRTALLTIPNSISTVNKRLIIPRNTNSTVLVKDVSQEGCKKAFFGMGQTGAIVSQGSTVLVKDVSQEGCKKAFFGMGQTGAIVSQGSTVLVKDVSQEGCKKAFFGMGQTGAIVSQGSTVLVKDVSQEGCKKAFFGMGQAGAIVSQGSGPKAADPMKAVVLNTFLNVSSSAIEGGASLAQKGANAITPSKYLLVKTITGNSLVVSPAHPGPKSNPPSKMVENLVGPERESALTTYSNSSPIISLMNIPQILMSSKSPGAGGNSTKISLPVTNTTFEKTHLPVLRIPGNLVNVNMYSVDRSMSLQCTPGIIKPSQPQKFVTLQPAPTKLPSEACEKAVTQNATIVDGSANSSGANKSVGEAAKSDGVTAGPSQTQPGKVQHVSLCDSTPSKNFSVRCKWCFTKFTSFALLTNHLNDEHQNEILNLCKISEKSHGENKLGSSDSPLVNLKSEVSERIGTETSGDPPSGTAECIVISDDEEKAYIPSPLVHFQCKYCPDSFTSKSDLREHRKVFHSSRCHHRKRKLESTDDQDKDNFTRNKPTLQNQTITQFYKSPRNVYMNASTGVVPAQTSVRPAEGLADVNSSQGSAGGDIRGIADNASKRTPAEKSETNLREVLGKASGSTKACSVEPVTKGISKDATGNILDLAKGSASKEVSRVSTKGNTSGNAPVTSPDAGRENVAATAIEENASGSREVGPGSEVKTPQDATKGNVKNLAHNSNTAPSYLNSTNSKPTDSNSVSRVLTSSETGSKNPASGKTWDSNLRTFINSPAVPSSPTTSVTSEIKTCAELLKCSMCRLNFRTTDHLRDHFARIHIPQLYERQRQMQIDKLYKGTGDRDKNGTPNT